MTTKFCTENAGNREDNGVGAGRAKAAGERAVLVGFVSHEVMAGGESAWPRFADPHSGVAALFSKGSAEPRLGRLQPGGLRSLTGADGTARERDRSVSQCRRDATAGTGEQTGQRPPSREQNDNVAARTTRTVTSSLPDKAWLPQDSAEGRFTGSRYRQPTLTMGSHGALMIRTAQCRSVAAGLVPPPKAANRPKDGPLPVKKFLTESSLPFPLFLNVSKNVPLRWDKCTTSWEKCATLRGQNVPALVQKCTTLALLWQSGKEQTVDKRLKTLKRYKLLTPTRAFALAVTASPERTVRGHINNVLTELMVYSLLAYRARSGAGASVRAIGKETGLHRATVNNALARLSALCYQQDGKWFARQPPDGCFRSSDKLTGSHWHDRMVYLTVYVPRKNATVAAMSGRRRFGTSHALVFSLIISHAKRSNPTDKLSIGYISALLQGLDRKTVARVLGDLRSIGIIRYEQRGSRLLIELLALTDDHLNLFEPHIAAPVACSPPAVHHAADEYAFKGNTYDQHRRVCEPLMVQSYAEQAIRVATNLGLTAEQFEEELVRARSLHEKNVKDGKCSFPNFGRYFANRLQKQWAEIKQLRIEEEKARRLEELCNSPEYKAAQVERARQADADPLHPDHMPSQTSVLQRVRFDPDARKNISQYDRLSRTLHHHCQSFVKEQNLGFQETIDATFSLVTDILKPALNAVNQHYGRETYATGDEFRQAIDTALVSRGLTQLFADGANTTGGESHKK